LSGFLLIGTLLVVDGLWERGAVAVEAHAEDLLSPDEAMGVPRGNHGGPHDDQLGADDEPGPPSALEVTT